jgi:hypothetical protein
VEHIVPPPRPHRPRLGSPGRDSLGRAGGSRPGPTGLEQTGASARALRALAKTAPDARPPGGSRGQRRLRVTERTTGTEMRMGNRPTIDAESSASPVAGSVWGRPATCRSGHHRTLMFHR